eukprot:TRINITY_DN83033_c0_g1_i1.p1 TRINITY_DN83033_c0_g1~~TRINITY_DN83033_c0_g1_i1.p1  ORF type:complete len:159 (-),score=7.28 TRINITY_DN83033_c0_g1_i1:138-614(-)
MFATLKQCQQNREETTRIQDEVKKFRQASRVDLENQKRQLESVISKRVFERVSAVSKKENDQLRQSLSDLQIDLEHFRKRNNDLSEQLKVSKVQQSLLSAQIQQSQKQEQQKQLNTCSVPSCQYKARVNRMVFNIQLGFFYHCIASVTVLCIYKRLVR